MANILKNYSASEATANLYLNDELADVRFVFSKYDVIKKVPANKAILASLSPVFNKMFYGDLKEGAEVAIADASAEGFKEFLQFFYLSKVTLTMEHIDTVARLADKYDILEHVKACAEFLTGQLTVENMCWGYELALILENDALIDYCKTEFIKSPKEILATEAFARCETNTLEKILKLDFRCNEVDIFNACLLWAKFACIEADLDENKGENIKSQLGDCFKLIRFGARKIEEFYAISNAQTGLFTLEEFQDTVFAITLKCNHIMGRIESINLSTIMCKT
ncbi:BTB/POZ domain-containing protein 6-B-like [Contarinia nasturtii]|uniref:BTB/POZ domain-containing protein 6-B-like n=1 Tax=Contarinia nasturtii TaxID=265458 RepID=UPI0012D449E8|nr:BTB/POZ domain-containing protein 6-B-like [Contarinia nasturtii]